MACDCLSLFSTFPYHMANAFQTLFERWIEVLGMVKGTCASVSLVEEIWISVTENTSDPGKCHEEAKKSSPVTSGLR